MLKVDVYAKIRRAHRDGMSIREIARRFRHSRKSIRKALGSSEPQPYSRREGWPAPKFTAELKAVVDQILEADESAPPKQRHWGTRIFERLRDEHGYSGGYDQVRRYVQNRRRQKREIFLPLSQEPGRRAECDFGHIAVDFPNGRRKVAVLLTTWSYSNFAFAIALPTERVEAILGGMVAAMEFFGCSPKELWWDNPTTVATEILRGRDRVPHDRYKALASHYNFEPLFCMPRRGNEKPYVENRVKNLQRRWATPVPRMKDMTELNAYLRRCCEADRERTVQGKETSIGERFDEERDSALSPPDRPFDPCVRQSSVVDKYQTVAFDANRYSVPRSCAFQTMTVKGYIDRVEIVRACETVATHQRSYDRNEQILDPLHYLVTLSTKPALLDCSDVYRRWKLPAVFEQVRKILEEREGPRAGARHYIRVLQLLAEHPIERITRAINRCQARRLLDAASLRAEAERLRDEGMESHRRDEKDSLRADLANVRSADADLTHFNELLFQGGNSCPTRRANY
jgi:transposase